MKPSRLLVLLVSATCGFSLQSPSTGSCRIFPHDNAWNWDISGYQVHPNSGNFVQNVGLSTSLHPDFGTPPEYGIPYVVVGANEPKVNITFTAYGDESDPGPYPVPLDAPVEGTATSTGDRHVIAVDTANRMLYELYRAFPQTTYWNADCGAVFNLDSNALRPDGWTSADAAGLPIFAGLVRYDEVVVKKEITHAIRMTVVHTQAAYIYPATHQASSSTNANYPPMGLRFRLKASFDISGYPQDCQVILRALKKYGMIVADNGSNWYISGAPDDRWNNDSLNLLKQVKGSDFEAVLTVDANGGPILPSNAAVMNHPAASQGSGISKPSLKFDNRQSVRRASGNRQFDLRGKMGATAKQVKATGVYVEQDEKTMSH